MAIIEVQISGWKPAGETWGNSQMALSGLQRFGRLVDDVLRADREGQVSGTPMESGTSSGTNSGDDTSHGSQKRRRLQLAADGPPGTPFAADESARSNSLILQPCQQGNHCQGFTQKSGKEITK